jgi:hypothetical protein
MCVALPKYICLRSFENQNIYCMSTWRPSFYTIVVDNVGRHPIFSCNPRECISVSNVAAKIIFELLMILERKDSVHAQ